LLAIPNHGATPLPNINNQSISDRPPAYSLLKDYATKHPQTPYMAVAGVWNPDKSRYEYTSMPLTFPESMIRKTKGKTTYYVYMLNSPEQGPIRILAAL